MEIENAKPGSLSPKKRVRRHRPALRAQGLRPVTHWVPDTRDPAFVAEYRTQCKALAEHSRAHPEEERDFWEWAYAVQADEGEGLLAFAAAEEGGDGCEEAGHIFKFNEERMHSASGVDA